jgi:hypothetical protein
MRFALPVRQQVQSCFGGPAAEAAGPPGIYWKQSLYSAVN